MRLDALTAKPGSGRTLLLPSPAESSASNIDHEMGRGICNGASECSVDLSELLKESTCVTQLYACKRKMGYIDKKYRGT